MINEANAIVYGFVIVINKIYSNQKILSVTIIRPTIKKKIMLIQCMLFPDQPIKSILPIKFN